MAKRQFQAGELIKDSRGQVYSVESGGNLVRVSPQRPWRGKSERRRVLRARREARGMA
jgi:hypothetical protein